MANRRPWDLLGIAMVASLGGLLACSDRALPLPAVNAAPPDLAHIDLATADFAADLAMPDLGGQDLSVALPDLPASDLATRDLRRSDAAEPCNGVCGASCATLCALGQPCLFDTDCASNACDGVSLVCVADPCHDHRQDGAETDVDCGDGICAGCSKGLACAGDANCATNLLCDGISLTCTANECLDHKRDGNETDVDCGGIDICAGCEGGQHCLLNRDCVVGHMCLADNTCTFDGTCTNHMLNFNETDVDCGGGVCPGCPVGKVCKVDSDCIDNACDPTLRTCRATWCGDGRKDGDETGSDCGGSCAACALGAGCKIDGDCASGLCDAKELVCVGNACDDHRYDGDETDVDCGGSCPPCAIGKSCHGSADCSPDVCDATTLRCVIPACNDHVQDVSESDVDCGGECAPCGLTMRCRVDQDCASHGCDAQSLTCVVSACVDHQQEAAESDVDCGGPCPACALGQTCRIDTDCASETCDETTSTCHVPWCSDGLMDQEETDIDCGGGTCAGCLLGEKCLIDGDCASLACDFALQLCIADPCADHREDDTETDIDCGGTTCAARCPVGERCITTADCQAGNSCNPGSPHLCM